MILLEVNMVEGGGCDNKPCQEVRGMASILLPGNCGSGFIMAAIGGSTRFSDCSKRYLLNQRIASLQSTL